MATVSYRLEDLKKAIVGIGYVGENDHMHVLIDCKEVYDEYPDAVPTMAIVPPVGEGYPKAVTRNGDVVEWLVKDSDVTVEGDGEFQLSFTEGEIIRKSVNARFRVKRSISGSGSAPSGVQDWLTDANEKLAEVEQATQDAEAAASHQPYIGIDGYWYTWNGTEFVKNVKAQGEKGDPGDPGTPGDPTQLIDDTQKSANKTYSSNKVDEELTSVKTDITELTTDKYEKPSGGIPATDLAQAVQTSLGNADTAYQKPQTGIPYSDIALGVIPYVTPEMYGAKGDGATDDSEAISAMFDVFSPVYVMNGNYICDTEIRIQNKRNITITGTGTIYKHSTASNSRLFDFLECENIKVEGLTIKSTNNKTPDSPGTHSVRTGALLSNVHAFTIDNSSFITFANVKFVQIGYCFTIGTWNTTSSDEKYRTKNIRMNNITMEDCGMGIFCAYLCDLSITDWIFDDMAISPGGYHMFYGTTCLKNINLVNLVFNGNAYSDDVILVESNDAQVGANGDSNVIVENITAECSHFASTEPNTCMIIKNAIIAMHNHYSEDMVSGNSSVLMTYYADNNAPYVVFDSCTIYHVDGTDKPLIAAQETNVNLYFINCDIRLNIGAYSVHDVLFHNCKMSGRRLVNTSLNTNFATNITFKECDVVAQGYSVLFNAVGKLILDNCRFKTNHQRVIHSTAQVGTIYAYNNIVDSSYSGAGSVVFGLDSTYLTGYRDLNNTVYTS